MSAGDRRSWRAASDVKTEGFCIAASEAASADYLAQNPTESAPKQAFINIIGVNIVHIQNPSILNTRIWAISAIVMLGLLAFYPQNSAAEDGRYSSGAWTEETIALDKADRAATKYAENNDGVGILIHLGEDVPNQRVKNGDELGQLFVDRFAALGTDARYFIAPNDSRSSGVTYHIGHLLYETDGSPVLGLQTAWNDAPAVIEELKLVKALPRRRSK